MLGMAVTAGGKENEYRVVERDGCMLLFGEVPVSKVVALFGTQPKNAVLDTHLARLTGATFAVGLPEATHRLRKAIEPEVLRRTQERYCGHDLSEEAIRWLAIGEQGISSQVMFLHLTGVQPPRLRDESCTDTPRDPDDLARCRRLLEEVPELQDVLPRMAEISPAWAGLIEAWPQLCATMDEESPNWRSGEGSAPRTYEAMRAISASSSAVSASPGDGP